MGFLYGFLKDVAGLAWNNKRTAIEVALAAALLFAGWMYHRKANQLDQATGAKASLEADLKQKITIANNHIEILTRENGEVRRRKIYVPPEGSVVIKKRDHEEQKRRLADVLDSLKAASLDKDALARKIKELLGDQSSNDEGEEIIVKNKGFTFRPGFGMVYAASSFDPRLDLKLAYWDRWGLVIGGGRNGAGIGVSRRLDDIIWSKMQNLELIGGYNFMTFSGRNVPGALIGFRVNF